VKTKILVECQECGKKFKTGSICPSCPKCGGSDVELGRTRNLCNQVHGVFTLMPEKVNCPDCLKIMQTDLARFKAYNEGPDFINGIKCAMNVEEKK
jgi:ABC-type ATPase with predicted acetyltransferase domain